LSANDRNRFKTPSACSDIYRKYLTFINKGTC
jgi:hypothetical protein